MGFTPAQLSAIHAANPTILVSAAAGSGKTAVLVERVLHLLEEGARLNRMLIVTFTRAAAAEMKERLNEGLRRRMDRDPERFMQALDDLDATEISTIHAFCQKVIREDFQAVGIDPASRVATEDEAALLLSESVREALNGLLEENEGDFAGYVSRFGVAGVTEQAVFLHAKLMSLPKPFDWLRGKIDRAAPGADLSRHPWAEALRAQLLVRLLRVPAMVEEYEAALRDPDAVPAMEKLVMADLEALTPLLDAIRREDAAAAMASLSVKFVTFSAPRKITAEQAAWAAVQKERREAVKKLLKDTLEDAAPLFADPDTVRSDLTRALADVQCLCALTERTHGLFLQKKQDRQLIDFSDMEQLTYDLLTDPDRLQYRERVRRAYDHIFVDEYQDVSQIQSDIIRAVHDGGNCLFLVGDVKQSIYRFRMANPTLFIDRLRSFSTAEDAPERLIVLQKNFRSRPQILDAANRVFSRAMRRRVTELDYLPSDALHPGREDGPGAPVEIRVAQLEGTGKRAGLARSLQAELAWTVRRIRELRNEQKPDGTGPWRYRDMVILMRNVANTGKQVVAALTAAGIPVFFDGRAEYFSLPEIAGFRALLCAIDDPADDLSLLAALKNAPFRFDDADLAEVRAALPGRRSFAEALRSAAEREDGLGLRCREALDALAEWRFRQETMPLFDFCWALLRETGYYAETCARGRDSLRASNLRLFCQKAADWQSHGGTTLHGFLEQVRQQLSSGDGSTAQKLGEGEDLVQLMTIHKSKGLQFPIVFCLGLGQPMDKPERSEPSFHREEGVCLPYVNRELGIRRNTLGKAAIAEARTADERAETCRLLYVAMTRASERLLLSGAITEEPAAFRLPEGDAAAAGAQSMLDWVMQAALPAEADPDSPFLITIEPEEGQEEEEASEAEPAPLPAPAAAAGVLLPWWDEPPRDLRPMPLKTSVTSLSRKETLADPMPLTDEDEGMEEKRRAERIVSPLRLSEIPDRPAFLTEREITGADRGTAAHRFLSLVPLEAAAAGGDLTQRLADVLADMTARGVFTPEEAGLIRPPDIAGFLRSPLGLRMARAKRVEREWRFNLRLPGGVLLQGVIDAAFLEEDGWVLLDYKTDRIEDEAAFVQRYTKQLSWYALAVERILRVPVKELLLYSLRLRRAFPVAREAVEDGLM